MGRPIDPLSPRNRNKSFSGRQIQAALAKREELSSTKRAKPVRSSSEFSVSDLIPLVRPPIIPTGAYSWTLEQIRAARDAQLIGRFAMPARLAEAMRTDDALFIPYQARLAPQRCLEVEIVPAGCRGSDGVAREAEPLFGRNGVGINAGTMSDIVGTLATHGVAFGVNVVTPREDGSRVDFEHRSWPIEFVWWNPVARCFMTRIDPFPGLEMTAYGYVAEKFHDPYRTLQPEHGHNVVPIIHGDGRWTVYSKHDLLPFRQDAALLPGAMLWGAHAYALRDWAKSSLSHGNAKYVGELPEGLEIGQADGTLSTNAQMFLELLAALQGDSPIGIKPTGAKVDVLANPSGMWEVFERLILNREKAAARCYLGTDAILGSTGGAPGVDISALFGIASTILSGDLECIQRCFREGVIIPWTAINFGDSKLAPTRAYVVPDADANKARGAYAERSKAFFADLTSAKAVGCVIDQTYIDTLARKYAVQAPMVVATAAPTPAPNGAPEPSQSPDVPPDEASPAPGDEPEESDAARLAAKMSDLGIERCQHGAVNRCRLCGIERVRDVELDANGQPVWAIRWKAI